MRRTRLFTRLWGAVSLGQGFRHRALGLSNDRRGNVGIIFGLSFLPALVMVGGALDFSNFAGKKELSQSALDSAVVAAATKGSTDNSYLLNVYVSNLGNAKITPTKATLSVTTDANNNSIYTADASYSVKTNFLGLTGVTRWSGTTHSQAIMPGRIITATFKPTNAQGAFSKDIFVWTKNASGTIVNKQTVMTYRWNGSTRTTSPAIGSWSTTFTVPAYTTYGVGLVVYDSTSTGYNGALINPTTKYSDASDASSWIHSSGSCNGTGGQTINMEDGGDSNFLDFVYNMTCTVGLVTSKGARLSN